MTQTEALKLALEALTCCRDMVGHPDNLEYIDQKITTIKEALAQPEPVKISHKHEWFRTGEMKIGQMRCISCGTWGQEETPQPEQEPVALKVYRGELCYKSQEDDQSFGMWCPVTQDLPFPEGTKFYTTPPQRKPLTDEEIAEFAERMEASDPTDSFWRDLARAIEAAHGIKE